MHVIFRAATRSINFKNANCKFRANLHATSSELSSHSPPTKKLLVLDLNGTIMYRPKRSPRLHFRGKFERPVIPRPFMQTFREYLFHEETSSWLDTMVWSSSQPHNVDTMVKSCFMEEKDKLVLIWTRAQMGLDTDSYNKDVPTMKDLKTVWDYFKAEPLSPSYSMHNTILVDDSFEKAALHPFNHICVREYDSEKRQSDVRIAAYSRHSPNAPAPYDATLLALIGILEELKKEPNVAKWIQESRTVPLDRAADCNEPTTALPVAWFENKTIEYNWAKKGKIIARGLGIDVVAGVSRMVIP